MTAKWRGDRNRMSVSLVSAELQVFTNYGLHRRDFYSLVICDRKLLGAAAGNAKYAWKRKRVTARPTASSLSCTASSSTC